MQDEYLTPADLSGETKISQQTLAQWRYFGRGPAYVKLGGHVRYMRSAVDAWRDASTHGTSDVA